MANQAKLGVCVAGLRMGFAHARAYDAMEDVDLYLCDIDADQLSRTRDRLKNVKGTFSSLSEVWGSSLVAAVDTALPHNLHRDMALEAAKHGKHFMTEKPMARTLAEAGEMIDAHGKVGTVFMVGENQRFMPVLHKAREIIDGGFLGKIFLVRVYEMWNARLGGWRMSKEIAGGGNLIDSGIHAVDSLRLLGGAVKTVYARTMGEAIAELEGEDTAHVSMSFESGAAGDLITSWAVRQSGPQPRFSAYGTEGSLWVMMDDPDSVYFDSTRLPEGSGAVRVSVPKTDTFEAECRHFVDCILQGKEPIMSGEEGRKDLEVVLAAYKSAETGLPVEL
ncbi:MAG: Gfo/Idh/MocA family oxidoreductase [Firmicutes bacterium]|nr:Gfo/Idh/MocA family oxidoreductase [Bacillota bacterium]